MKLNFAKPAFVVAAAMIAMAPMSAVAGQSTPHGTFVGASNHVTSGGVQIVKTADGGAILILDTDFSLDNGPDPRVGFGADGTYAEASDLGELQKISGLQIYVVPPSVNVDNFNEVYIWCKEVGVPLGIAPLS